MKQIQLTLIALFFISPLLAEGKSTFGIRIGYSYGLCVCFKSCRY